MTKMEYVIDKLELAHAYRMSWQTSKMDETIDDILAMVPAPYTPNDVTEIMFAHMDFMDRLDTGTVAEILMQIPA